MLRTLLMACVAIALAGAASLVARAQTQPGAPQISRAVYWANADAEVYLLEKGSGGLRLTVVSKKQFKVTYHTRINSIEPVDKVLEPISSAAGITVYDFNHNFTKMTIWMSLEFSADGKTIPELTRTFLNDIQDVVANDYFGARPRPKP